MRMIPEEYAHRMETLVKVTKLLGDKYKEQDNKIERLIDDMAQIRIEMIELKDKIFQKSSSFKPAPTLEEEVTESPNEIKIQSPREEILVLKDGEERKPVKKDKSTDKDSEKRDLIEALKVIENL